MLYDELHVSKPVLADGVDEFMHGFRLQQEVCEGVFKGHQHVKLLENSGAHDGHGEIFVLVNGIPGGYGVLPALRAVGGQIRNFYIFFPLSYIFDDLIFRRHQRHSRGSVFREQNVRAPGIIGVGSPHPVSPDVLEYGISGNTPEHRIGIAETFRFSIFFQSFQQIFFWRQHIIFPFLLLS